LKLKRKEAYLQDDSGLPRIKAFDVKSRVIAVMMRLLTGCKCQQTTPSNPEAKNRFSFKIPSKF
jgi:hypothetical protein